MSHSYTKKGSKFYRYYVCQHAQSNGWQECPAPSLPAVEIEKFVVKQIKLIGRDEAIIRDTLAAARRKIKSRTKSLVRERAAIRRKLGEYVEAHQPADSEQRLAEIEAELLGLTSNDVGEKDVTQALGDFDELWETLLTPEKTRIIELLIERVSYDSAGGQLDVTYRPTGIHTLAAEFKKQKATTR